MSKTCNCHECQIRPHIRSLAAKATQEEYQALHELYQRMVAAETDIAMRDQPECSRAQEEASDERESPAIADTPHTERAPGL